MSGSESGKKSIRKLVPDKRMDLKEFLVEKGINNLEKRIVLVNGSKTEIKDRIVEKDDEIIVLPILRGG